jgi:aryl-alcohol dehydrogenase-like predicted oxidoreductase
MVYRQAEVIYDEFYRQGGNTFDTAHSYERGFPEKFLGMWALNRGVREEINIITKCGHPPTCWPQCVEQELTWSLLRLQTDYVDGLMLHRDNLQVPVKDWVEVLARLQDAGKIRAYGFSNWTLPRMREALEYCREHGVTPPRLISQNFSLARMVNPVWPGCESAADPAQRQWLEENSDTLTLLPWSSQARGFFTDRSAPEKRDDEELVNSWYSDDNFERKRRATELAEKYGVMPLNIALAYTLHQPFPVFPLIGPRNLYELRTCLPGLNVKLTEDEVKWLDLRGSEQ